jgi:hypothetical protein
VKDFFKNLALSMWTNHRKKLIAFILGLLFAGIASISGIPLSEIQDAAKDAANKPAPAVVLPVVPLVAPIGSAPQAPAK